MMSTCKNSLWLGRLRWYLLSVPTFVKILGISVILLFLLGGSSWYQIRKGMTRLHYLVQGENALSLATSIAGRLEPILFAGNTPSLDLEIHKTMSEFPDVRYIVVQDKNRQILSHGLTFPKELPVDILQNDKDLCSACHDPLSPELIPTEVMELYEQTPLSAGHLRSYVRHGNMVLEVTVPVGTSLEGTVRLGVGNEIIAREENTILRSLMASFLLTAVLGIVLASVLTFVLVRPIHALVDATRRVRQGDFSSRAKVFSRDEFGRLAETFNQMTEHLEVYQQMVKDKEMSREMVLQKIVQTQEEERRHVARELHDQLGQMLSKTLLLLDSTCDDCNSRHTHCPEIRNDIRAMIDEVRQLAWRIRPSILDDYGLNRALESFIRETSKRVPFTIDYQGVVPEDMEHVAPLEVETALYRIAQEAITNIMRHANATEASIVLIRRPGEVILIVEDNGQGFSANPPQHRTLGLLGMRERTTLVGGSITIDSAEGKGTTVRVVVPLKPDTPSETT